MITCKACGERMASHSAFDVHECPATPKPRPGESFEDFSRRAAKFADEWRGRASAELSR